MAPLDNNDPNINPPIVVTTDYQQLFLDRFILYKGIKASAAGLFYRANDGQPSVRIESDEISKEFVDVAEFGTGERYSASA
jgi:hypothetical protein